MLNPAVVKIILLRKVAFYNLKLCHIQQVSNVELQNLTSASFHSACSYTIRPIHADSCTDYWFIYMFGRL